MSVSSIDSGISSLSLVDLLQQAQEESDSLLNSSATLASSNNLLASLRSKQAMNAYGGGSAASAIGQAALSRALSEMTTDGGPVTFKDIAEYRQQLEAQFSIEMRAALALEGVSLDTEFSLSMDASGKISVECDDAVAREKIQNFLSENPEACEQFGYIQALSNLERARQSPAGVSSAWNELTSSKKAYQAQAVEAFFSDALSTGMDYSSILASFGASAGTSASESTSFYAGLSFTV